MLNADLYEDARRDSKAIQLARIVVFLAAVSHALGSSVILLLYRASLPLLLLGLLINGVSLLAGYYFWSFTICKFGQWWQLSVPSYKDLLGPIGFAHTPQVLNFFTVVPLLGRPIEIGLATWSLLAAIVAVNRGLNISLWRAVVSCTIGWLIAQVAIGVVQVLVQGLLE